MLDVLHELTAAIERQEPVALATVVEVKGSSPAQVGFKLLVRPDGSAVGNLGGGALEQRVREEAVAALREGQSRLVHYTLREEGPDAVGMVCGGEVTAFVEVYQPSPVLLIVGGGHIGQPLAEMARIVGFDVQVVDVRPERATVPQLDPAAITPHTCVVLITGDHVTDEQALRQVLNTPAAYVGMIGSRRKVGIIFEHLRAEGVSEEQLARVHAPIGLDLGGRKPTEIALAILAEIEMVRHGGSGRPLSGSMGGREHVEQGSATG
ncbi:MAG TPA: XdhC family protein [Anaerolineae bacterium]|nr:XdhC family protein [Anaerolineae bacterium]